MIRSSDLKNPFAKTNKRDQLILEMKRNNLFQLSVKDLGINDEEYRDDFSVIFDVYKNFINPEKNRSFPVLYRDQDGYLRSVLSSNCAEAMGPKSYKYYNFPVEWANIKISDLEFRRNKPYIDIFSVLMGYCNGVHSNWLYLFGRNREEIRKSIIAGLNTVVAVKQDVTIAIIGLTKKLAYLHSVMFEERSNDSLNELLKDLVQVDYLVLEEFGSGQVSEYNRDCFITPLLVERERSNRPTIFISPYSPDEIIKMFSTIGKTPMAKEECALRNRQFEQTLITALRNGKIINIGNF